MTKEIIEQRINVIATGFPICNFDEQCPVRQLNDQVNRKAVNLEVAEEQAVKLGFEIGNKQKQFFNANCGRCDYSILVETYHATVGYVLDDKTVEIDEQNQGLIWKRE